MGLVGQAAEAARRWPPQLKLEKPEAGEEFCIFGNLALVAMKITCHQRSKMPHSTFPKMVLNRCERILKVWEA